MPAVTDFANPAAAVTAGYAKTQIDRGVADYRDRNPAPRYATVFSKPVTGASGAGGDSGQMIRGFGESSASAAAADTQATAALNADLRHRYGGSPGRASGDSDSPSARGGTHTKDVT